MAGGGATNEYGLTVKQEKFSLSRVELGDASEAYRLHYNSKNMKPETVNRSAKELMDNPKIAARVKQLQSEIMVEHKITIDSLLGELEEARTCALTAETVQSSAAVSATMSKAKLLGLDKQIVDHQSSDGSMTPKSTVIAKDVEDILDKL